MSINPKELQKFYDLWSPMLQALPAVINAVESSAELDNHIALKRAEFDKVAQECEARVASAESAVQSAKQKILDTKAEHTALRETLAAEIKAEKDRVTAAKRDSADKIAALKAQVTEAEKELAGVESQVKQKLQEADREIAAKRSLAQDELDALQAKIASAEKTLNALRAKLG